MVDIAMNRFDIVACMNVEEFRRATLEGNHYVVCILNHTMDTHGPAQIVLTSHLHNYIIVFMQGMRFLLPNVNNLDKQSVHLMVWKANEIYPNDQSLRVNFNKAVYHTLFCKRAVSCCHDNTKRSVTTWST